MTTAYHIIKIGHFLRNMATETGESLVCTLCAKDLRRCDKERSQPPRKPIAVNAN